MSKIFGNLFAVGLVAFATQTSFGQTETEQTVAAPASALVEQSPELETVRVALQENGELKGLVFAIVDGEQKPITAKVTLSADGVVVDTVEADEEGNFSFASVEPGSYQMYGYADGYSGGGSYDVGSYSSAGYSDLNLGLSSNSSTMVYDNYGDAPAMSFASGSCGNSYGSGSCGSGCGSSGGGLRRPLLLAGVGLGIAAIAGAFDGKDSSSPDN